MKIVWIVFAFPSYNLWYSSSKSFSPLANFHAPVWMSFQHFILCTCNVMKYLLEFISCQVFLCYHHFLWDVFIFFVTSTLQFYFQHSTSLLHFHLCWPSLFRSFIFIKSKIVLSVHELENRHAVISQWMILKEVMWLATDHVHLLFT